MSKVKRKEERGTRDLSMKDMEIIKSLQMTKSVQKTADTFLLPRPQVYRIIKRANKYIGYPNSSWRENGVFQPPPEICRLINVITYDVASAIKFPRIVSGHSLSVLVNRFLIDIGDKSADLQVVGSIDALDRLLACEVDLILRHKFSNETDLHIRDQTPEIIEKELVKWQIIRVTSKNPINKNIKTFFKWPANSFADRLRTKCGIHPEEGDLFVYPSSFISALELLRQGVNGELLLPNILMGDYTCDLKVERLSIYGSLVTLSRNRDSRRLELWNNEHAWRRIVKHEE